MGRRRSKLDPERLILNLRLKDLNRLLAYRHGGDAATYTLPDDDAGREYLYILISHYANVDPNVPRRIIKLRAPWMSADEAERIVEMAFNYHQRWRSSTLGRELNYSEAEWRRLRLRTNRRNRETNSRETSCSAISLIRADGLVSQGRTPRVRRGSTGASPENNKSKTEKRQVMNSA
jgi:hypothetical protein